MMDVGECVRGGMDEMAACRDSARLVTTVWQSGLDCSVDAWKAGRRASNSEWKVEYV